MQSFAIKVYGCQMNVYDADKIRTVMTARGWEECPEDRADVVIYVGCSIRKRAEDKVWSHIGCYSSRWRDERKPVVCLTGCMGQNRGREMMDRFPWLRLISGPRSTGLIPDGIDRAVAGERVDLLDNDPRALADLDVAPIKRENHWKAFVTITHGCDYFCTYCIVPYVRGRLVSRNSKDIIKEIKILVDDGVKEVMLLGQNVDTYGVDFDHKYSFADLLRDVAAINGLELVRFMTSYPNDFTQEVVDVISENPSICAAINLPIQSGSDRILKKMNRHYNLAEYDETVRIIREGLPDAGLTSDIIVGFPGETEEDFEDSIKAIKKYRFDQVHTAAYSIRTGTPAAKMEDQIPKDVKSARLKKLNDVQAEISLEIYREQVGKNFRILIESKPLKGDGLIQGRTQTDKIVICEGPESLIGQFVDVKIVKSNHWCLTGEIIKD